MEKEICWHCYDPLVVPAADTNIISVNPQVLLGRTSAAQIASNHMGLASAAISLIVLFTGFMLFVLFADEITLERFYGFLAITLSIDIFIIVFSSKIWWDWLFSKPIVFNRSTQLVSTWAQGYLWQTSWCDLTDLNTGSSTVVSSSGGTASFGLIQFTLQNTTFPLDNTQKITIAMLATEEDRENSKGKPRNYQSQQLANYIIHFMNVGVNNLPSPIHEGTPWHYSSFWSIYKLPINGFKEIIAKRHYFDFLFFLILTPIFCVVSTIFYPFDKWMPRPKMPAALQAAIDARGTNND